MKIGDGGAARDGPGLFTSEISWLINLFVYGNDIHFRNNESICVFAT